MMTVQCPSCSKMYNIPETMAGKQVRCKGCGTTFVIASAPPQAPAVETQPAGEAPMAPISDQQPGMMAPMQQEVGGGRNNALIGGVVVGLAAVAALAYFVVIPMVFGGQPGWTKALMPEGTKLVAYIDIESIRESELFAKLKGMVKEQSGGEIDQLFQQQLAEVGLKSNLKLDDVKGIFVAGSNMAARRGPPNMVIGLRVARNMTLSDLISGAEVAKKKHNGYEYVIVGLRREKLYLAQIDDETFCGAPTEELLKKALDRIDSGDSVELDDDVASVLSAVSGSNTFVAGTANELSMEGGDTKGLKSGGVGLDLNGSIDILVVGAFENSDQAEKAAKKAEEGLEKGKKALDEMAKMIKPVETIREWLDDVDIDQSGNTVEVSISIPTDDVLEIFDTIKQMAGGLMGGGPSGPPPQ